MKDPTSDMAVIARNGSKLVKEIRDKKEANKSRARFWEVAGSKIGQITGGHASCLPCSFVRERFMLIGSYVWGMGAQCSAHWGVGRQCSAH